MKNIVIFDGTTGKAAKDSGINTSAITANTAKVTNATHTGDATGATTLTLATVNSNVGSFTNASVTVNAKGLVTAVSTGASGITAEEAAAGTDNNQTGTAYTLVLTDADNKTVWMSNAASNIVTIPTNASVAFPVKTKLTVMWEGVGETTVTGDTGVTVNGVSAGSKVVSAQFGGVVLQKRATNTWIVTG